jgi:hypothetical protein
MSADKNPPVIDSVTPSTATPTPGTLVKVVVAAHDADARSVTTGFNVVDGSGNATPVQVTTVVGDPVRIDPASIVVTDPAGTATAAVDAGSALTLDLQL